MNDDQNTQTPLNKLQIEAFPPVATEEFPYEFNGRWAKLSSSIRGAGILEFHLKTGVWQPKNSVLDPCPPDGYSGNAASVDQLIRNDCLYCALLGKLGGGTADHIAPSDDGTESGNTFAIGSFCVLNVEDSERNAPLYIGFNCIQRPIEVWNFELEVFIRT